MLVTPACSMYRHKHSNLERIGGSSREQTRTAQSAGAQETIHHHPVAGSRSRDRARAQYRRRTRHVRTCRPADTGSPLRSPHSGGELGWSLRRRVPFDLIPSQCVPAASSSKRTRRACSQGSSIDRHGSSASDWGTR
jgi:hypothetical protein